MAASVAGACGAAMDPSRSFRAARALLPALASVAWRKWSGACKPGGRRSSGPGSKEASAEVRGNTRGTASWGRLQGPREVRVTSVDLCHPLLQGPAWVRTDSRAPDLQSPAHSSRRRSRSLWTSAVPLVRKGGEARAWARLPLFASVHSRTCLYCGDLGSKAELEPPLHELVCRIHELLCKAQPPPPFSQASFELSLQPHEIRTSNREFPDLKLFARHLACTENFSQKHIAFYLFEELIIPCLGGNGLARTPLVFLSKLTCFKFPENAIQ